MFFLKFLKQCYRWKSIFIIIIPFFILANLDLKHSNIKQHYDSYKDFVDLFGWLFGGIMSLVGISTLFLAFTYENKLLVASNDLKRILKPYSLSIDELRNTLINYKNSLTEDKILKILYRFFIIMSFFIILIWGAVIGFFTNFRFSLKIDLTIGSLLNFGAYAFFAIIVIALFLLSIAIKLVRLNKDPLDNGFLPPPNNLSDIDFLESRKGDISEFIYINAPYLDFYKNPYGNTDKYELVFSLPIKVTNLRFTFKFYNQNRQSIVSLYGKIIGSLISNDVGDTVTYTVSNNLEKEIYSQLNNTKSYGVLKIFNKELKLNARYHFQYNELNEASFRFILDKKIFFEKGSEDTDSNLLVSDEATNKIKYQKEMAISTN